MPQRPVGELGDLASHLDAGRAGADHDEGQQATHLVLGLRDLGQLEGAEDPAAELERVSAMTIEERIKSALTMKDRFDWLQPAAGQRASGEK